MFLEKNYENFFFSDDGEESDSSLTKVMGVVGLVVFFALVALTVLYRRRSRRILRSGQMANPAQRSPTDSWLYPETHEFRDEVKSNNIKDNVVKLIFYQLSLKKNFLTIKIKTLSFDTLLSVIHSNWNKIKWKVSKLLIEILLSGR